MELLTLASKFFFIANPIGNSPAILALVKDYDIPKQKKIMLREAIFALLIAIFFQYFGKFFLEMVNVQEYSLRYCGGILLFLVALSMIFPIQEEGLKEEKKEPYFVPIATPLIGGPAFMSTIMVQSNDINNQPFVTLALLVTWIFVTLVMVSAPYMLKVLKKRGLIALEQLMGMILMMISIDMIVNATYVYMASGGNS